MCIFHIPIMSLIYFKIKKLITFITIYKENLSIQYRHFIFYFTFKYILKLKEEKFSQLKRAIIYVHLECQWVG